MAPRRVYPLAHLADFDFRDSGTVSVRKVSAANAGDRDSGYFNHGHCVLRNPTIGRPELRRIVLWTTLVVLADSALAGRHDSGA